MTAIGVGCLGDATSEVADRLVALTSSLAASPERGEVGRLVLWCLIWIGACGLLVRRDWARRLLLAMVALRTLGLGYVYSQVLPVARPDSLGAALTLGIFLVHPAMLVVLWRGHVLTPVPPLPLSMRRVAAVSTVIASALAVVLLLRLLPADRVELASLPRAGTGELEPLRGHTRWRGERIQVVALRDGRPVTRKVADWDLTFAPEQDGVVLIQGLHFAGNVTIRVDVTRNAMLIHDVLFQGRPISGKSPLFGDVAFRGVAFEGDGARINGKANILVLADGRVALDFDKVFIDGRRSHEYGSVAPDPTSLTHVDSTSTGAEVEGAARDR